MSELYASEPVEEEDWLRLSLGDYVRVTCNDEVFMGVIDDWGYSEELLDGDNLDEDLPYDQMYLHCREDDGSVRCVTIDLMVLNMEDGTIERFPAFQMSLAELDDLLMGGH